MLLELIVECRVLLCCCDSQHFLEKEYLHAAEPFEMKVKNYVNSKTKQDKPNMRENDFNDSE